MLRKRLEAIPLSTAGDAFNLSGTGFGTCPTSNELRDSVPVSAFVDPVQNLLLDWRRCSLKCDGAQVIVLVPNRDRVVVGPIRKCLYRRVRFQINEFGQEVETDSSKGHQVVG